MHEQTATLLVNAAARGVPADLDWQRVARFLAARGIETTVRFPQTPSEATLEAARAAERGDRWLFVAGGDGSLRVAAAGLACSATALAAVPLGTVNVWAREASIPRGLRASLECHLEGQVRRIDLGRAGEERFILMASAGWDASVARDVPPAWKRRLGDFAYVLQGARSLSSIARRDLSWEVTRGDPGERAAILVASNTRLYGGRVRFTPGALADDGLLDAVALMPPHAVSVIGLAARLLAGRLQGSPHTWTARVAEIQLTTPGVPVQCDGDYVGDTPLAISLEPRALAVSLPAGPLPPFLAG